MTPELETNAEAHKTGHRWIDLSVAGCALLVSFCSLGLAVHHGRTMEKLVQANSMPFVQLTNSRAERAGDGTFREVMSFDLRNAGVGPARAEWLKLTLDGKLMPDWASVMQALRDEATASGEAASATAFGPQSTSDVPAFVQGGSSLQMLRWPRTAENAQLWGFINKIRSGNRLQVQTCYCSIFDECWIADSVVFRPNPVESC